MREVFQGYRPNARTQLTIEQAREIIVDHQADGLVLTLRQLFYQFVAQGLMDNTQRNYKNLGKTIARARLAGMIDWDAIEDRVRRPVLWSQHESAKAMVEAALPRFRLPRLEEQPSYVELWVEKDALAGVLEPVAADYHVTLMVNRGYASVSSLKESADRIRSCVDRYGSEDAIVFYLGDFDPSGEDMVRDIRERLEMFLNHGQLEERGVDEGGPGWLVEQRYNNRAPVELCVEKLALTMEQVREYDPPPNPAKISDSRAKEFIRKHGRQSWEVDALPPRVLRQLIRDTFDDVLDLDAIAQIRAREETEKERLRELLEQW